jgi:hypothetical protein
MPPRLICVAIMLLWAFASVALFRRDILPNLLAEPPPDLRTIAQAEADARPTRWTIQAIDESDPSNPRAVGEAVTQATRKRDGWYAMTSTSWVDSGELLRGTAFQSASGGGGERVEVGGEFDIDPSGNLDHFRAWVRPADGSHHDLLTLSGKVKNGGLAVQARGPLPMMTWTQTFPYQPRGVVQANLGPLERMPGLRVGQRWETRVVSPLTGRVETGRVEVTRRFATTWDGNPVSTLEVVTRMGAITTRTWVRPLDGLVLRQEVPFGFVKLVLERVPDDPSPTPREGPTR